MKKLVTRQPPIYPNLESDNFSFKNILKDEFGAISLKDFVDLCREKKIDLNKVFFENWRNLNINDIFFVGKQTKKQYLKELDNYEKENKEYEKWYKKNKDIIRHTSACDRIGNLTDKELDKAVKTHLSAMKRLKEDQDLLGREFAVRRSKKVKKQPKRKGVKVIMVKK